MQKKQNKISLLLLSFFFGLVLFISCEEEKLIRDDLDTQGNAIVLFTMVIDTTQGASNFNEITSNFLKGKLKEYKGFYGFSKSKPIEGAQIKIKNIINGPLSFSTNEDGYYLHDRDVDQRNPYEIEVSKEDYAPQKITIVPDRTPIYEMAPGDNNHGFVILRPYKPELKMSSSMLDLGKKKEEVEFVIRNKTEGTLRWWVDDGDQNIELLPNEGEVKVGKPDTLRLRIDKSSLSPGHYERTFYVHSNGGDDSVKVKFSYVQLHTVYFIAEEAKPLSQTIQVETFDKVRHYIVPPTKKGHTFKAWYLEKQGTTPSPTFYDFNEKVKENKILYAHFTIENYVLFYEVNGGKEKKPDIFPYNTAIPKPTDPMRKGYTFLGWYADATLNTTYPFGKPITKNDSMYAKWTINQHITTFNSNGGSSVSPISTDYNTAISKPADPTKPHYTFAGWYKDAGLTTAYNFTTKLSGNQTLYAKWTIKQYTITFNSNGGSAVAAISTDYNTTISKPADPTKSHYTFAGWYKDAGLTTAYNFTTKLSGNQTLYAKWSPVPYTTTFNSNGGSAVSPIKTDYNTTISKPADPTKPHYTFAGWYKDAGLTTAYNVTTDVVLSNQTLYAKWSVGKYTITFNSNGGSAVSPIKTDYNTTISKPAAPTKPHYTFAGWYSDAGLTTAYNFTTKISGNQTIYAKWTIKQYTITFNSNGGSSVSPISTDYNTTISKPADPTKPHYTFAGWYSDAGLTTAYNFTTKLSGNQTLYAKWSPVPYTTTFNSNGGSAVSPIKTDYNTAMTKPADPTKPHYTFAGWYKDAGLTTAYNVTTDVVLGNQTLYAKWSVGKYTTTFNSNGGSAVSPIKTDYNTTISKPADPTKPHYTFAGWYKDAGLTTAYNFTTKLSGNQTLYAKWTIKQYTITFNSNGGSAVATASTDYNTTISKPTNPTKPHYTFAGWYKDAGLTTAYNFTTKLSGNQTLYAKWSPVPYTTTFNSNGGSAVSPIKTDYNTAMAKPADPTKPHYTFAGWYKDAGLTTAYNVTSDVVLSNQTLYAKWSVGKYTTTFNSNGGSAVSPIKTDYNTAMAKPADPTKPHYTFAGWYSDAGLTTAYNFTTKISGNQTIYAKWTIKQYTITFNSNGGSSVSPISTDYNTTISKPADPTKQHYTFAGWYKDAALTTAYNFTTKLSGNQTLYAKWTIKQYTITFNSNGGSAVSPIKTDYNTTISKPADPTNSKGKTLVDWYTDANFTTVYNFNTAVTKNLSLYARWAYLVTYDLATQTVTGLDPAYANKKVYLNIPGTIEGVTMKHIAEKAFYKKGNLDSLSIPNTIETIGGEAFYYCSGLSGSLTIPNSVDTIGDEAFSGCSGFSGSLTIPNSVTTIGIQAFLGCSGLSGSLTIGNSVTTIGRSAFFGCWGFSGSLTIGNSVTTIGDNAFFGCSGFKGSLTIPNSVTTIGRSAFAGCSGLSGSLTIGNSVKTIGRSAFNECKGLSGSLTIPNSVTTIGIQAFYACSGFSGSLTIPNSVDTIGSGAFKGCRGLSGSLTIPNSVTTIGGSAFQGCSGFTGSLTIPNSVTTIGIQAFLGCRGLSGSLTIGNSVTTIGGSAFQGCRGLSGSLTIPNSVDTIGYWAFRDCTKLSSVEFLSATPPKAVFSPSYYGAVFEAFKGTGISSIKVPSSAVNAYKTATGWKEHASIIR